MLVWHKSPPKTTYILKIQQIQLFQKVTRSNSTRASLHLGEVNISQKRVKSHDPVGSKHSSHPSSSVGVKETELGGS